jgi:predicted amidophosphoribosyltransferase
MPLCPNCGSRQPDGAAFCDECGAKLGAPPPPSSSSSRDAPTVMANNCPVCQSPTIPGEAFCENCGAPLAPESPAYPPTEMMSYPQARSSSSPPSPQSKRSVCADCGARLQEGSRFCDMCGAPLDKPAYTPPAGIPGRLIARASNTVIPFPPGRSEVIIGREDLVSNIFPDIDLSKYGGGKGGVSRKHARIFLQAHQVLIEDLNSTNYTHVNRQRLTPGRPHPLNPGDKVQLGRVKLTYAVP